MTAREALLTARDHLKQNGIQEAPIEAEVLLRHVLGLDRAAFFRTSDQKLSAAQEAAYGDLLRRRLAGEPTAYITGSREFYGLELRVTAATLIPRPETETLVEEALALLGSSSAERRPRLADVGTGSGAIAIALASRMHGAQIWATDSSEEALSVARENARRLGFIERISFVHTDLLAGIPAELDLVAANLPYVADEDFRSLPPEIRDHEPTTALLAGADGLSQIRRLLGQAAHYLAPGGSICLEFGYGQADAVEQAASGCFPAASIRIRNDLAGIPRVLTLRTAS